MLTRFILKAMLYPQILKDIDTTEVKLRRRHKTFVRIKRKGSEDTESSDEDKSSGNLERQDAIEYNDSSLPESTANEIYGSVQYKTGKYDSSDRSGTIYESYIDYGEECGAGDFQYHQLTNERGTSIDSICFITDCDGNVVDDREFSDPSRDSIMIGSTPLRIKDNKRISSNLEVHLTTARLNLLEIKQKSEQSAVSSFEHRLSGAYMACEDLVNLDDSTKIRTPRNKSPNLCDRQDKHHSMPVQFVGNRFNSNPRTEIYIPTFKDRHETSKNVIQKSSTPHNSIEEEDEDNQEKNGRHSSSMNLSSKSAFLLPIPDNIQAEILYNLDDQDIFTDKPETLPPVLRPFSKHSINSDKRLSDKGNLSLKLDQNYLLPDCSESPNKRFTESGLPGGPTSVHNQNKEQQYYITNFKDNLMDYYDSHVSSDSDSGMASITVTPDQRGGNNSFISHRSQPSNQLFHDSGNHCSQISDPQEFQLADLPNDSSIGTLTNHSHHKKNLLEIIMESPSVSIDQSTSEPKTVYCTGFYAHWWKKEKLPNDMMKEIFAHRGQRGSGKNYSVSKNVLFQCYFPFNSVVKFNEFS